MSADRVWEQGDVFTHRGDYYILFAESIKGTHVLWPMRWTNTEFYRASRNWHDDPGERFEAKYIGSIKGIVSQLKELEYEDG